MSRVQPKRHRIYLYLRHTKKGWMKACIDEQGQLWVYFGISREDLDRPGIRLHNITRTPQYLKGYRIVETESLEVEHPPIQDED